MTTCQRMSAIVLFNQQKIRDRHKRDALIDAFRRADKNGDGRLSVDEVYGIYVDHGVEVTREEVAKIVEAADKDGTGLLTEKEFVDSQKAEGGVNVSQKAPIFVSAFPPCRPNLRPIPLFRFSQTHKCQGGLKRMGVKIKGRKWHWVFPLV